MDELIDKTFSKLKPFNFRNPNASECQGIFKFVRWY